MLFACSIFAFAPRGLDIDPIRKSLSAARRRHVSISKGLPAARRKHSPGSKVSFVRAAQTRFKVEISLRRTAEPLTGFMAMSKPRGAKTDPKLKCTWEPRFLPYEILTKT